MRSAFQFLLTASLVLCAAASSQAQFSTTNVFTFSTERSDLKEVAKADADTKLHAKTELKVRPNAGTEVYLWVLNPTADKDDFTVEVKGLKGSPTVQTKVSIPGNTWVRVKLPKPAPPAPVEPKTPPAPPAAVDPKQPPAAEPPPGIELAKTKGEARLTFRLLDKNGADLKDDDGRLYGRDLPVTVLSPADYVKTPVATLTPGKGIIGVKMVVAQSPDYAFSGSAPVQLLFPPQDALKDAFIRDGYYRRMLTFARGDAAEPVTLTGTIENASEKARIYVGIDGIDRAFTYILNPLGKTPATQLLPNSRPAVRVALVPKDAKVAATQPTARFPVQIEVDNATTGDSLEVRIQPVGAPKELAEVVKLEATREVQVWLDTVGPTDGGLLFSTRSHDWVKPLDLSSHRGKVEIAGVLETKDRFIYSEPILVTVDATPPEQIAFLPIQATLEKGKPLLVAATVFDPETDIVKATFFLCKKLEDGKMPADAIKADGTQSTKNPGVWVADLKVPADFRGEGVVGVVFANQVGLVNDPPKVQRIEIVDPKAPAGTIDGKVEFGGRPQPGVAVALRDADNKDKGGTTTDDKGKFKFEKVAPGNYTVVALKKDSSTGAAGASPVQVEADKTSKPTITLSKLRK
jgi:Carboxypeptidase regulatory-like domain